MIITRALVTGTVEQGQGLEPRVGFQIVLIGLSSPLLGLLLLCHFAQCVFHLEYNSNGYRE